MTQQYEIPSHCQTAVIFERAIMFIFEPVTVPFYHSTYKSDAEDFFVKYCLDCSLRARACAKAGAMHSVCLLNNRVQNEHTVGVLQMPIPKHVMVLYANRDYNPEFGYETADAIQPLRLGNIGSGGGWCSGDVVYNNKNPSNVYNGYMRSIHNSDLTSQSSDSYPQYLQEVAQDFTKIYKGYPIDPDDWGYMLHVVDKPTSILWSSSPSTDYHKQGQNYVKIQ